MVDINKLANDSSKVMQEIAENYDFNITDALEEVATLANEPEDWRNHLPYQAAISYFEDDLVRNQFIRHVDNCNYCQLLLDSLHASNKGFLEFKQNLKNDAVFNPVTHYKPSDTWFKYPITAALAVVAAFIVIPVTWDSFSPSFNIISNLENKNDTANIIELFENNPQKLTKLENLGDPSSKFQAARFYLAADQYNVAYKLIGEGLEQSGIDKEVAYKVSYAAKIDPSNSSKSLEDAAKELNNLSKKNKLNNKETLRISILQARLGLHEKALKNLKAYLDIYEPNAAIALTASFIETP